MRLMSRLILILVLPVFLASSVTMAVARHQPRVAGEVWLCSGTGMVAMAVDADGNPVGPMQLCPDCTLTLSGLEGGADLLSEPLLLVLPVRYLAPVALALPGDPLPLPPARGPPAPV